MLDWLIPFNTVTRKKRAAGLVLFAVLLTLFLLFNRLPKFGVVEGDLEAVRGSEKIECFQGFCIEAGVDTTLWSRWWEFSLTYLELVAFGMTFAFLVAGVAEAFLFPSTSDGRAFSSRGLKGTLKGLIVGPAMTLCSACIVPISSAFRRRGASVEATISIVQGSATLNLPALIMAVLVFAPMLSGSRIALSILGALLIGPLVAMAAGRRERESEPLESPITVDEPDASWREAIFEGVLLWARASFGYLVRLGPIMVVAAFASGLVVQWLSPATVSTFLGNNATGVVVAATIGVLINVPLMFEIPLVAALLLVGMGTAPAATLLFAAAAGGPITFWGLARVLPRRATAAFVGATWSVALIGGLAVMAIAPLFNPDGSRVLAASAVNSDPFAPVAGRGTVASQQATEDSNDGAGVISESDRDREFYLGLGRAPVTPFTNVAPYALKNGVDRVWNWRPGVVVFDYDRDGDLDFYVTDSFQNPNLLYRNEGDGTFVNVAEAAGVAAFLSHGTGVVACDLNNDGYQDLYVGARGLAGKSLDFRSALGDDDTARRLHSAIQDRLFVNNRDGTFTEITDSAFGDDLNLRSANSIVCADVDGDGWLDIYVGNLFTEDFFEFDRLSIPGHFNVLYLNNGDLTFRDVAESAGVQGPEMTWFDAEGRPITFEDPETGRTYVAYDPTLKDARGNPVGDPTGQTFAVLFFDYDDDGDPDLWLSNDGDRLLVFRNDSTPGNVKFVQVATEMGIDLVGDWMGFAVGDYDGDADLDIFITNGGYHPLTRPPEVEPGRECPYSGRFEWATCAHFLLRNDGTREVPGLGSVGNFIDVAATTVIVPSFVMPPDGLDPNNIVSPWEVPTGLAAYGFGFGTTFFDFDNDGDQDLYWLGSARGRGQGPQGYMYPGAGHMLRGDGQGSFEDITVRARLLDIQDVDYASYDPRDPEVTTATKELREKFHENGKGLAHGDFNGDGYVDLIGTNSTGPVFVGKNKTELQSGPIFVWMNGGGDNHWISLRLTGRMAIDGTGSNADGIGARVYVTTTPRGETEPLIQVQEVLGGSSYLSMDSIDLEFGVGTATVIEEITINWPSGRKQVLNDVSVDQVIGITEPRE
ncbi:MAG: VCBS repeat-containing protein [Chloroflexi bacterium]|nr:VCBS repeat-containing protein [Chloroflexota bacterium]